jgi:hypothetical protein
VKTDFSVANHGSIYLLRPNSILANDWIDENLPEERQEFAGAAVIEHRYIGDIVAGIQHDGLTVGLGA